MQTARSRAELAQALVRGRVRGFVVVPPDFSQKLKQPGDAVPLLIVTDGAEPNTANFVENYIRMAWEGWLEQRAAQRGASLDGGADPWPGNGAAPAPTVTLEPRFWFNPSAESRNYLIPGSITIIMTVIGALLTSLVVAREWERGTMEALLASPVTRAELLLSKLLPYYALGIISLFICVGVAVFLLGCAFSRLGAGAVAGRFALSGQRPGPGIAALDRHPQPVQRRPGRAQRRFPAGGHPLGLHL